MYQGPIRFAAVDSHCRKVSSPWSDEAPVSWMIVTARRDAKGFVYYVHVPFLPDDGDRIPYSYHFENALLTLQDIVDHPELCHGEDEGDAWREAV